MTSTDDWILTNASSVREQREKRAGRDKARELKKQRKELLNQAESTQERRAIKEAFKGIGINTGKSSSGGDAKGSVYDVSTENPAPKNKQGYGDRIESDSVDRVEATGSSSGGEIEVIWCVDGVPHYGIAYGTIGGPV